MSLSTSTASTLNYISNAVSVLNHPLLPDSHRKSKKAEVKQEVEDEEPNKSAEFFDPLGVQGVDEVVEKFSTAALHQKNGKVEDEGKIELFVDGPLSNTLEEKEEDAVPELDLKFVDFKPWREYKKKILDKFYSENVFTLESSFLKPPKGTKGQHVGVGSKPGYGHQKPSPSTFKFTNLTEEDFIRKFRDLRVTLLRLWAQEERVQCISLCREVAQIMTQSSLGNFYPKAFVLVTDFMDIFGHLVYQRLLEKAKQERRQAGLSALPTHFSTIDVLEKTRIVARNWFGKLGEITDVIPHLYIGCALMPIMKFMDENSISENLDRLCQLAAILPHPLVASYARCFVCRVAMRIEPSNRAPHWKCLNDWMQTFKQQPVSLLWPPLEYIIQCVAYSAVTYDDILPLWEYAKLPEKRQFVFKCLLHALPSHYLAEFCVETCKILVESPNVEEITAFGESLEKTNIAEPNRKPLLKAIWKMLQKLGMKEFVEGMAVWIEFVAKYFTVSEIQIVLDGLCGKLENDRVYLVPQQLLLGILSKILSQLRDVSIFLTLPVFSNFTALFTEKNMRKQMSVQILEAVVSKHKLGTISDLDLAYQVSDVCKILHDCLDVFSSAEESSEAVELIKGALNRFDVKPDPENALSFYVATRANLLNLDECQKHVIDLILELALYVIKSARFSITRSAFVQACIANTFITIPSISDIQIRMDSAIKSAEIALAGQAYLQLDSLMDLIQEELENLQNLDEIVRFINQYLGLLMIVPKFDEEKYLKWVGTWIKVVDRISGQIKPTAILSTIQFLYALKIDRKFIKTTILNSAPLKNTTTTQNDGTASDEQEKSTIDQYLNSVMEMASQIIANESENRPVFCVKFLELLSIFVGKVDEIAYQTAKSAFKKCRKATDSTLQAHFNQIHFNS
ncbi:unnamed protein product [Bursaphelenchus okinawaensis]|uniref:Uncharacterized protein n=1 Tax=Bursaphelenchus okinawaensis TaxID=465554 RepID=A0A811KCE7_9BILA|nr:unnamed protein product [Bursaphelenchus okinawaensis]CAG9098598.1 unnamed protein product [Bursaphelenchus okinawaensis]